MNRQYPRLAELPFDSDRKLMTSVNQIDGKIVAIVKGAFDMMAARCVSGNLEAAKEKNDEMSRDALRVLAVGYKILEEAPEDPTSEELENGLTLLGLVGMIDPPRPEAKAAVATCRQAGIKPVMITGDHVVTASAIAKELGILEDGDKAITGAQLDAMTRGAAGPGGGTHLRVRPGFPGEQDPHCQGLAAQGPGGLYDRRRRQRRPCPEGRGHRLRHGHHRHRRGQGRRGHDPHRRQLRHHCGRCPGRPWHLRQHQEGGGLPAGHQYRRGAHRVLCHDPVAQDTSALHAAVVDQPGDGQSARHLSGHGGGGDRRDGPQAQAQGARASLPTDWAFRWCCRAVCSPF